jgi:HPt (histidine-containing phosphotransfer) domain-containing protein
MSSQSYKTMNKPEDAIDLAFVEDLIEAIGIEDFINIVKTLHHEVESQISVLEARSQAGDLESVKLSAHRLAGMLSQFGAFEVAACAEHVRLAFTSAEVRRLAAALVALCRSSLTAIAHLPVSLSSIEPTPNRDLTAFVVH